MENYDGKFGPLPPPIMTEEEIEKAEEESLESAREHLVNLEREAKAKKQARRGRTEPRTLRTPDAARYLGISEWQLRQLVYKRKLPVIRGKYWLFDLRDLDAFIQDRKQIGA